MAAAKATLDALDPSNSSKNTLKIENTDKRDTLIASEKKYQKIWQDTKVFQQNAPSTTEIPYGSVSADDIRAQQPKFFGTMAYPYMNGVLHAGHSFTASKVEFATGVARMQGKRALFPQGYHCTGMPIKACADKLVREIEMFGKNFEGCPEDDIVQGGKPEEPPAPTQETTKTDMSKFKATKGKAAAKAVKTKYQFQIMLALGIPLEEIHNFADPQHWLQYFPPECQKDLTSFGARVDWRRSMVTTDANPFYDSFVRWQMNRLKGLGKIKFGKRYTVYSPKDGQACLDHDRSSGEGVTVQEYVALKLKVLEWPEKAQKLIEGKLPAGANVYFVPATLRPETMYGQTCCFVGPKVKYGIFHLKDNEYYFVSDRAARNMSFQNLTPEWGVFPKVVELEGSDVVGTLVNAPLSVHKNGVRILPMETVKPTKGTGVVTCVPSDSPDDYATTLDLIKKADYYGIKKEWAELEILPIIKTPSYGDLTAKALVEKLKINSPKDAKLLADAKELAYKEGFYQGTMVYGDFTGKPVQDAKPLVKQQLVDSGLAFNYGEPDGQVMSRSGDDCVAAYLDQWFFNYGTTENGGDGEWCETVLEHLENAMNTFYPEAKHAFKMTLGWLSQWACSRSYGLGTKLPWDPKQLVESLSDSTIYMSYYTISHFLHGDVFGQTPGISKQPIKPEQMTDEVWDYLFTRTSDIKTDILKEDLESMRREFEYWYPLDLRVSGKDLIQNHLTFCLYIHTAIFPKQYWPQGFRVNGHLMLNGEKMSKSTGNFLTLGEAVKKFGADATRVALADAGDGIEDANFEETVANSSILKLFELRKWCEEVINDAQLVENEEQYRKVRDNERVKNIDTVQRTGPKSMWDEMFENEMNSLVLETKKHYEETFYKLALKSGFFDFTGARDFYREVTKAAGIGMHADITRRYVELQTLLLTPVTPHWSEYMWLEVLKKPETVQNAVFPTVPAPVPALTAAREYVRNTSSNITSAEGQQVKRMAKGKNVSFDPKKDKKLSIFAAQAFPAWQDKYIELVRAKFDGLTVDVKAVSKEMDKAEMKKAMPFVQGLKRRLDTGEKADLVFDRKLPFDELATLSEMVPGLKQTVPKLKIVEIISISEGGKTGTVVGGDGHGEKKESLPQPAEGAVPGQPTFHFENL
ncbi:leucyl-tRNA synthetase [Saccharata proteae CBS 121410]|uniref:leucine--tRNA ligase n=1 Tax=Saccharata proteae CBS 121410 TaxID=1314787 RepID=A0A9P4I0H0_9PEZI|nr:leucyl-tRNA synthetase [Saccharata proteae CBS 121410]